MTAKLDFGIAVPFKSPMAEPLYRTGIDSTLPNKFFRENHIIFPSKEVAFAFLPNKPLPSLNYIIDWWHSCVFVFEGLWNPKIAKCQQNVQKNVNCSDRS